MATCCLLLLVIICKFNLPSKIIHPNKYTYTFKHTVSNGLARMLKSYAQQRETTVSSYDSLFKMGTSVKGKKLQFLKVWMITFTT